MRTVTAQDPLRERPRPVVKQPLQAPQKKCKINVQISLTDLLKICLIRIPQLSKRYIEPLKATWLLKGAFKRLACFREAACGSTTTNRPFLALSSKNTPEVTIGVLERCKRRLTRITWVGQKKIWQVTSQSNEQICVQ